MKKSDPPLIVSYESVMAQIAQLQRQADHLRKEEVVKAIKQIHGIMETFSISRQELLASFKMSTSSKPRTPSAVQYIHGNHSWTGRGPKPKWLREALTAGAVLNEFKVT